MLVLVLELLPRGKSTSAINDLHESDARCIKMLLAVAPKAASSAVLFAARYEIDICTVADGQI